MTADLLGAWVIKCNAQVTPLAPMLAAGRAHPRWCVADNYRSRLMAPGHPVLFWVSAHPCRGIWGAGKLTTAALLAEGRLRVGADVPMFHRPVRAADITAIDALRSMEVFTAPQQANPSWVSTAQYALLATLLPNPCDVRDGALAEESTSPPWPLNTA